jgi:hypothetical protein
VLRRAVLHLHQTKQSMLLLLMSVMIQEAAPDASRECCRYEAFPTRACEGHTGHWIGPTDPVVQRRWFGCDAGGWWWWMLFGVVPVVEVVVGMEMLP